MRPYDIVIADAVGLNPLPGIHMSVLVVFNCGFLCRWRPWMGWPLSKMFNQFVYKICTSRINSEWEQSGVGEGGGGGVKKKLVVFFPSVCAAIHPHLLAWELEDIHNLTFAWTKIRFNKSHPRTGRFLFFSTLQYVLILLENSWFIKLF